MLRILLAFDKVEVPAGETKAVSLSFEKEDMASYCDTYDNGDGSTGCWMLEGGDYVLTLGKNSHEAWETRTVSVPETIWYSGENIRQSDRDAQSALDENGNVTGVPARAEADPDASLTAPGTFSWTSWTMTAKSSQTCSLTLPSPPAPSVPSESRPRWTMTVPRAGD